MKKIVFLFLLILTSTLGLSQEKYQLSSHILDISKGLPAPGVDIQLEKWNDSTKKWEFVDKKTTDNNGRIKNFLKEEKGVDNKGIYKMIYFTAPYFKADNLESFYPFIEVVFEITSDSHYHVPITLSPFGYSTYRGS